LQVGDFFLYLYLAQYGSFKRLNFCGAVYRYGVGTFTSSSGNEMRNKFKKSILVASRSLDPGILRFLLLMRFNQDKLYHNKKKNYHSIRYKNFFSFVGHINFINLSKGIIKFIFKVEKRRVFGN
jgi:hypothetical protein